MVSIKYLKNGKSFLTNSSNEDLEILTNENKPEFEMKLKANTDISLVSAVLDAEYKLNDNDVYFYNGYQSWTDTHLTYKNFKERNSFKINL